MHKIHEAESFLRTPSHPISLRIILILSYHLHLGLPNHFFPSDVPTKKKIVCISHLPIRATCPVHVILDKISLIIFAAEYKL